MGILLRDAWCDSVYKVINLTAKASERRCDVNPVMVCPEPACSACESDNAPATAATMAALRSQLNLLNNSHLRVFKLLSRCGHKSVRRRCNPRPRCARAPPLAINRSQRVGLINRALNYCISRHNNEVSSFRKKYGHHVGGRRGRNKSSQIIAYEYV